MADTRKPRRRWYRLTCDRLLFAPLAAEGLLIASQSLGWSPRGWTVLIAAAMVGVTMLVLALWLLASLLFGARFQFGVRSLLVLAVAVAIPCSWFAVEMKKASHQAAAVEELAGLGCEIHYDYEIDTSPGMHPVLKASCEPPAPEWLRKLLGEDFFMSVGSSTPMPRGGVNITDAAMVNLERMTELQNLELWCGPVTDAGLRSIRGLTRLTKLRLANLAITDAGLENVQRLTQLRTLDLRGCPITDAGLVHLHGMSRLEILLLFETNVTDAGLAHLEGLPQLQWLNVSDTGVTDAGLIRIKRFSQLWFLDIGGPGITDAGLVHLGEMPQLRCLWLRDTRVTDAGLAHLKGLPQLCDLGIIGSGVTDAGLVHLGGMTGLHTLYLKGNISNAGLQHLAGLVRLSYLDFIDTPVTAQGVKKLQQALPACKITITKQ